jgi:steroid 5-alpha reductase family enzyme
VPRSFGLARAGSFAVIAGVYAVAVSAAWLVFQRAGDAGGHPVAAMALGLAASTGVTWLATRVFDNGSVFDPWWSVLPPVVAAYFTSLSPHADATPRQVAVHAVVWFWAARLTLNWARGWSGLLHEDWRYALLDRTLPLPRWAVQLVAVEGFPTAIVTLGCISLHPALALGDARFHPLDAVALAVGLASVWIEAVADEQLHAFARTKRPGQILDTGLWRFSRHPNYFGEIGFWVSLWLFALSAAPGFAWAAAGPLAMIAMFVFASVPLLDARSRERRPGFDAYAARTSALVPWPPRRGGA